jgi:hypothetical protein
MSIDNCLGDYTGSFLWRPQYFLFSSFKDYVFLLSVTLVINLVVFDTARRHHFLPQCIPVKMHVGAYIPCINAKLCTPLKVIILYLKIGQVFFKLYVLSVSIPPLPNYSWMQLAASDYEGLATVLHSSAICSLGQGSFNRGCILSWRQILAGSSLLRSAQTQVGEPKIGEHAQWHYFASVTTQRLR